MVAGLPDGYREEVGAAIADGAAIVGGSSVLAEKLALAGELAFDWCIEVLKWRVPHKMNRDNMAWVSMVTRCKGIASQTILTMLARTNDQQLRRQQLNQLPELLALIRDEEKRLPLIDGRANSN